MSQCPECRSSKVFAGRHFNAISGGGLQYFRPKGLKLVTWTVNGEAEIAKFAAMGVDGIITDFPEQFPAGRVD